MKDYYTITKPGIIYGNAVTVVAGFLLASKGNIDWVLLVATLVGLSLVVASGCVFNNYIDRDIDLLMERTKKRVMAEGRIPSRNVLVYASLLGLIGLSVLFFYTNLLAVGAALAGLFVYVVVYSLWFKRTSTHGTIVGSISGAMPPVVGYLAVTGSIDLVAVFLFFILALWQMPHSFAIALYRLEDYKKAGIPVLPVKKGILATKIQILVYVALFVVATLAFHLVGYIFFLYSIAMVPFGIYWLVLSVSGFFTKNTADWARKMFIYSIVILLVFSILISIRVYRV